MLQRIQSIYLFLAGLAIFALFLFPLAHNVYVNGIPVNITVTGTYIDAGGHQVLKDHFAALTAVTAILGVLPFIIIFIYKNRKQQIAFCYSIILVIIGYSFWLAQTGEAAVGTSTQGSISNAGIGLFLCPLSIFMIIMAIKGIQRDEKLIKSADRLR